MPCEIHRATRRMRGTMKTTEMAAKLREIAALIEGLKFSEMARAIDSGAVPRPVPSASPAPGEQVIDLTFVKIGETSSGKSSLRIGYKNAGGETVYLSCFDEAIVDANRDLRKGMTCAIRTKPWKDTHVVTSLKVVDSEIPF